MYKSNRVRVKICCISSHQEAQLAIQHGADAVGLVGKMPSGPGVIEDQLAAQIVSLIPPPIGTFMLTSETTYAGILTHYQSVKSTAIQLVDQISPRVYAQLHQSLPSIRLVQVIHVLDNKNIEEALEAVEAGADALLLDSGNPNLTVKELGGTGRVHNWQISRQIVEQVKVPVFLAGGLNALNAREAIDQVNPFGLDICSGVRNKGSLDLKKLEAFMAVI
jgi:phosphoribosylanthranilate isomerase